MGGFKRSRLPGTILTNSPRKVNYEIAREGVRMQTRELIIDSFAGGGGASTGIEMAAGRSVDVAINHDHIAINMHKANHPDTKHYPDDIWSVDPREVIKGRSVGLAWFSPDCRHFSRAKGGKPVKKEIRGLAWVVLRWADRAKPRVIILENVEEFQTWGPLKNNRPCPVRKGETFKLWVSHLEALGYQVEWRVLRACDYGSPTIRKRLFIVARRDGQPIVWPDPTHGPGLIPHRTAAEIIDWGIPCPSIFTRKRPLADATLLRIARGLRKFVIEAEEPFIISTAHTKTTGRGKYNWGTREPLRTIKCSQEHGLVVPHITPYYGPKSPNENRAKSVEEPLPTQSTENRFGLITAHIAQHNKGAVGRPADAPLSTITTTGAQSPLVTAFLSKYYGKSTGQEPDKPIGTISGKNKNALVTAFINRPFGQSVGSPADAPVGTITPAGAGKVNLVQAFLLKYYGTATGQDCRDPLHSITAKARMGIVVIHGVLWQITDIGMRMLTPRELFRAQGFPESYIIDASPDGKPFTKAQQTRLVGNSVCPQAAEAVVRANYVEQVIELEGVG